MKFISEALIEQAAESLNASEENYERTIQDMEEEQPILLAYFFTENFEVFTQEEREYLLYLMLVIWKAVKLGGESPPRVAEEQLSQAEGQNWEKLQGVKAKGFHERLTPFFCRYPQEDLLAFAEDALADDEEESGLSTREGREAMFVSLKAAIDCLAGAGV